MSEEQDIVEEMQSEGLEEIVEQDVGNIMGQIHDNVVVDTDGVPADSVPAGVPFYKSFKCHVCKLYFSRLHTLKAHITTQHPQLDWNELYRTTTFSCSEPGCDLVAKTRTDLLGHLREVHGFVLHRVEGEFNSVDDFTLFFEQLQKIHKVRFVKKRGRAYESMTQYFVCSRDGYRKNTQPVKARETARRRNSKSHKIGTFCTAHVTVRNFPDGQITIEGYTTHYNHLVEGKHLALLEIERKYIKYLAQQGLAIRDIIDRIHRTIGADACEDDPLRFLNSRTIRNVIHSVQTEVDSSAMEMFARLTAPDTLVESRLSGRGRKKEVTLVDVVRGHTTSLGESYEIFIDPEKQQFGKEEWGIKNAESSIKYKVERLADKCANEDFQTKTSCHLMCVHCKCCAHIYTCNCQSGKHGKMCQHIHAICQYLRRIEREQKGEEEDDEVSTEVTEDMEACESIHVDIREEADSQGECEIAFRDGTEIIEQVVNNDGQIAFIAEAPFDQRTQKVQVAQPLVFHDYEKKSVKPSGGNTIDPDFVRLMEEVKEQVGQIENAINNVDAFDAAIRFESLKSLINRSESPKVVTVEELQTS